LGTLGGRGWRVDGVFRYLFDIDIILLQYAVLTFLLTSGQRVM
jgi:hypothetical protein